MLRYFFKTAFRYAVFVKYKARIYKVLLGVLLILISYFLYQDISQSLQATQKLDCLSIADNVDRASCVQKIENYRLYALLVKWFVVVLSLVLIVFSLNPIEKSNGKMANKKHLKSGAKKSARTNLNQKNRVVSQLKGNKINHILQQAKLKSQADKVWDELEKKK